MRRLRRVPEEIVDPCQDRQVAIPSEEVEATADASVKEEDVNMTWEGTWIQTRSFNPGGHDHLRDLQD